MIENYVSLLISGISFDVPQSVIDEGAAAVSRYISQYTMGKYTPDTADVQAALSLLAAPAQLEPVASPVAETAQEDTAQSAVSSDPSTTVQDTVTSSSAAPVQSAVVSPQIIEVPAPYIIYMSDASNNNTASTDAQALDTIEPETTLENTSLSSTADALAHEMDGVDDVLTESSVAGEVVEEVVEDIVLSPEVVQQLITLLSDISEDVDLFSHDRPFLTTTFSDYSVTEGLLLTLTILVLVKSWIHMLQRGFSWLL